MRESCGMNSRVDVQNGSPSAGTEVRRRLSQEGVECGSPERRTQSQIKEWFAEMEVSEESNNAVILK